MDKFHGFALVYSSIILENINKKLNLENQNKM